MEEAAIVFTYDILLPGTEKLESKYNGSGTNGKVEKIEKHSNILKEKLYYLNDSMLEYAKTLGNEPYLYYSRKALHYKLEISRNKEKSRDMDTLVHKTRRI